MHTSIQYRLFPSVRIFMVFLAFCGMTVIFCGFAAFNFAIVCMVTPSNDSDVQQPNCEYSGEFSWDKAEQVNLVAASAWGSILTSVLSGLLSDKFGSKFVFLACLVVSMISTAITPWAAFRGEYWLFVARMFTGMASGAGWPSMVRMATRWGCANERAFVVAVVSAGSLFGQLVIIAISGVLCKSVAGWPSIFYISSGLSGVMALIWLLLYTDHPSRCRFISKKELECLNQACLPERNQPSSKVPWRHILLSPAALAIYVCHFCNIWLIYFINEFVPTYGKEVLNLDLASNGFLSALPLLCQVVSCVLFGILADKIKCGAKSVTFSVKVFNTMALGIPCAGLVALTFLGQSNGAGVAIFCLCLCAFFYVSSTAGFIRCMVLIAPKFSGTISSVSNTYSYAACIAMPYVIGVVTADGSIAGWHLAFYIGLGVSIFGCLEFLIFGTGEMQKWAQEVDSDNAIFGNVIKDKELSVLKF